MSHRSSKARKIAGAAAGIAGIASISAYISTQYLLKIALNKEEPLLLKAAERRISGTKGDQEFMLAVAKAAKKLEQKDNEIVEIVSWDWKTLIGHWIPVKNAKRIVIAVHGWRGTWTQTFGMVADRLEENGCSVLYIEQRATSNSGGDYIGFGLMERYDCLDWIRWVNSRCGTALPIYLCGVSMGATTVMMAAGLNLPANVHGIIADCGFTSPHAIWKHIANNNLHIAFNLRGVIADDIFQKKLQIASASCSTTQALSSSKIPVLLIHGAKDHFVPVEMTYENYQACSGPKRLLIVPGADHSMSYFLEKEKYEKTMKEFWSAFD